MQLEKNMAGFVAGCNLRRVSEGMAICAASRAGARPPRGSEVRGRVIRGWQRFALGLVCDMTLTLNLPDDPAVLDLSPEEARLDLACALYARGKVGKIRGAELAGVDFFTFQGALFERGIPLYTSEMLEQDMESIRQIRGK
jgi:predicted HTH domain antitoxin